MVNPDGVINQVEGGIIQSASWVLKEQVRFDNGVASFDWETYPVLKFSEVPEIDVALINTKTRSRSASARSRPDRLPRRSAMPCRMRWARAFATCRSRASGSCPRC